jgi:cysteine desulfuration protein SufE
MNNAIPARLKEVIETFQEAEGQEKLQLLLEYSDNLPPLPDWLQEKSDELEQVHECMTPVFVHAEMENGGMHFYFDIPPASPTVRGYAAILEEGLEGARPEEVLAVPGDFYQDMGLHEVLTHQRLKGISAILAHLKRLATQHLRN